MQGLGPQLVDTLAMFFTIRFVDYVSNAETCSPCSVQGLGPQLVDTLPTGNLTDVAIFIDLALKKENIPKIQATTKSGVAAYNFDLAYDPAYRVNVA